MPTRFDGLSARLIQEAGFEAAYLSGGAVARSMGIPDIGLVTLSEVIDRAAQVASVRGLGLMIGVECATPDVAARAVAALLRRGVLVLPSGDDGRVLALSPPLSIGRDVFEAALGAIADVLR